MPTTKDINLRISGTDAGAGAALDGTAKKVQTLGQRLHEINLEARRNGTRDIERLLKGGGALGLAHFASEKFAEMAKGMKEIMEEVREGTMTAGQGVTKFVEQIPIIGSLTAAFKDLGEVVHDFINPAEAEATRLLEKHTAQVLADLKASKELADFSKRYKAMADEIEDDNTSDLEKRLTNKAEREFEERNKELQKQKGNIVTPHDQAIFDKDVVTSADKYRDDLRKVGILVAEDKARRNAVDAEQTKRHFEELGRIGAEGNIAGLRAQGRDNEAAFAEIREKFRVERQKIRDEAIKEMKGGNLSAGFFGAAELSATNTSEANEIAAEKRKQQLEAAKEQLAVEESLSHLRLEDFRLAAEGGDYKAELALKEAEIHERTKERLLEIQKILEKNLTLSERIALAFEAAKTKIQEKASIAKLQRGEPGGLNFEGFGFQNAGFQTVFGAQGVGSSPLSQIEKNTDPDALADKIGSVVVGKIGDLWKTLAIYSGSSTSQQ